jgi:cation diffusion facilitator CzcD-associated flavoprotein CzcO
MVLQLHSSRYRNPGQIPAGTVLVAGGGNTGYQIAQELSATHDVHLSIGSSQTPMPQHVLGRDLFRILESLGAMRKTVDSRIGKRLKGTKATPSASDDPGLWTARRVAERYGVAVRFIYQHAEQLGCIRLGGSARPRLRFDPAVVRDRWQLVGGGLPDVATPRRRPAARKPPRRRKADATSELLEFDRDS